MPDNFGYQGFRSWGMMTQPTLKPGETTGTRASKFADVGHGVVYKAGVVPENAVGRDCIVVRRQLDSTHHGVSGNVYVVASSPVILMAYRFSAEADGGGLQGKAAGDDYMQRFKSL